MGPQPSSQYLAKSTHRDLDKFLAKKQGNLHHSNRNRMKIIAIILVLLWNGRSVLAQSRAVQARVMYGYSGLIFNQIGTPIVSGNQQTYSINILDPRTLVVEIAAPTRTPLMVQIQPIQEIWNNSASPPAFVPFAWEAAFCNEGINDERIARRQAMPLNVNQNQFQFEMNDYQAIPGNPEPVENRVKAFLYVYGRLGPVGQVAPGYFTNSMNIEVWY